MTLKSHARFEEKLTCGLENGLDIFTRALESLKIGTLMGSFCSKQKMHELKIYREVLRNNIEK